MPRLGHLFVNLDSSLEHIENDVVLWVLCSTSSTTTTMTPGRMSAASPVQSSKFQRAVANRSTFHGGTVKDRSGAGQNKSSVDAGVPSHMSHGPGAGDTDVPNRQGSFFNRITSRLSRRYSFFILFV